MAVAGERGTGDGGIDSSERLNEFGGNPASGEDLLARLALEASTVGTWMWDPVTDRGRLDDRARAILGRPPGIEQAGRGTYVALLHPDDRERVLRRAGACLTPAGPARFASEHRIVRPDGQTVWVRQTGGTRLVSDRIRSFRKVLAGTLEDITDRGGAGRALRSDHDQVLDAIDEGFCIVEVLFDGDGRPFDHRFLETNPAFERHTGLKGATGKTARQLVPDLEQKWVEAFGRVALTGVPERFVEVSHALNRWFYVDAFRVGSENERRVGLLFRDVTELRRAEAALRDDNAALVRRVQERTRQVRQLATRLTLAEQEERRRIAQVLHDDLQQLLVGIDMKLNALGGDLRRAGREEPASALDNVRSWVDRALETTRRLTMDFTPPVVDAGFTQALRWLRRQMKELHDLEVVFESSAGWEIADQGVRIILFRTIRELLFNVAKHAGTAEAVVRLDEEDGELVIHVIDEGCGFEHAAGASRDIRLNGFGLRNVRERIGSIGGRLEIDSRPGDGTRVTVYTSLRRGRMAS